MTNKVSRGSRLFLVSFFLAGAGCSQWATQWTSSPSSAVSVNTSQTAPGSYQPGWAKISSQVVVPYCVQCHKNPTNAGGVNLETYSNAKANSQKIIDQINQGKMPQGGSLSEADKATLLQWLAAGAPEQDIGTPPTNQAPPPPPPPPPPPLYPPLSDDDAKAKLNFNYVRDNILIPRCLSCHDSDTASGHLNVSDLLSVQKNAPIISNAVFGAKANMPPFKDPVPAVRVLSDDDKAVLYNYLLQGAPQGGDLTPLPVIQPTFADIDKHIFQVRCMDCHVPGSKIATDDPLDKKGILDPVNGSVVPLHPETSALITALTRAANEDDIKAMPPFYDIHNKKIGYSAVPADEIEVVKTWIKNGAKD